MLDVLGVMASENTDIKQPESTIDIDELHDILINRNPFKEYNAQIR